MFQFKKSFKNKIVTKWWQITTNPFSLNSANFIFFKRYFFLWWFYNNFTSKQFYLLIPILQQSNYKSILTFVNPEDKMLLYTRKLFLPFLEKKKTNSILSFEVAMAKFNLIFLFHDWKILEFFLIPEVFWFNLPYLLKKTTILKNFITLFHMFIADSAIMFDRLNTFLFYSSNIKSIKFSLFSMIYPQFISRMLFFISNQKILVKNYERINQLGFENTINFFFRWLSYNWSNFAKSYIGYQTFINNCLYGVWSTLFLMTIAPSSFDFLLLKNFNKVLFRVGDKWKKYWLWELFRWRWNTVLFHTHSPYYAYWYQKHRNNFLPIPIINSNRHTTNNSILKLNTDTSFLYHPALADIICSTNLYLNNKIFYNQLIFQ